MSELLTALQTAGAVLGLWTLASLAAVVPLVGWVRQQALVNELGDREARQHAWLAAARSSAAR